MEQWKREYLKAQLEEGDRLIASLPTKEEIQAALDRLEEDGE